MTLRSRLLALLLALTAASSQIALAQAPTGSTDQLATLSRQQLDVVKVLIAQERAWNDGDLDGFAEQHRRLLDIAFGARVETFLDGLR